MKPWKQVFILVLASGALIDATAGTIRGLRLREKLLVDLLRNAP